MKATDSNKNTVDPVCGMIVSGDTDILMSSFGGSKHYFCAETCRKAFEKNPRKYLKRPEKKGFWKRYLERLNKATGGRPPACCG